ncbi:hypothetical protein GCM10023144_14960 [Pigmentiphaga soli]|uniref:Cellulose synthase operon protein YhjQ n=1 Tax=Pigmentiphaga soli TaxID=1007095 RepID=A0ABP8GRD8_9BURK
MKIVAVVSAKGGVGKTTVTANLSTALGYGGHTVLTVDLDPQNALRFHFGLDPQNISGTARASLGGTDWRETCFRSASGVYVLPYGSVNEDDRHAFEDQLEAQPGWLGSHLATLGLGDDAIVMLDTPPGPSIYMKQALSAAHLVLIVSLPDAASYATLPLMEGLIQTYCTPRADFIDHAYVINQVDSSRQLAKDVTHVMRANFGDRVVGLIHLDPAVSEALAFDKSVLDYAAHSQATLDFVDCARWVSTRLQQAGNEVR